jgi:hypothetical protein
MDDLRVSSGIDPMFKMGELISIADRTVNDCTALTLMERVASDGVIDAAFAWLCEKRQHYHFNNDVWQVRRWRAEKKPQSQHLLLRDSTAFGSNG